MNKYLLTALSVTGGIISGLAWSIWCSGLVLLFSFVPFFLIENHLFENSGKYRSSALIDYLFPGFIVFNIMTLGWIRVVSITAAIGAIIGVAFLMALILWLAHIVRIKAGNLPGFIALFSFWLAFEFLSLNTVYLSPWANLGNGLSKDILFIQWYEVTGVGGGSFWILSSNLFLTLFLVKSSGRMSRKKLFLWIWLAVIIIPSAFSLIRFYTVNDSATGKTEVLIIQPNSDPYTEKFSVPFEIQLRNVIELAEKNITKNTNWVLTPETTVDDPVNEEYLGENKYIMMIKQFTRQHPGISVISGLVSSRINYSLSKMPSDSSVKSDSSGYYFDHFNSAFEIDTGETIGIYHKSKLVPGIEMEFSAGLQKLLSNILPELGGTKWGYGIQKERTCFEHPQNKQTIAPIICYESVFGNYVAEYVRNGAEALFIITNDGWWKNTNGYRQHLSYASLRAIETRRQVARAANTGISCIIDIRGRRTQETEWWTESVIRGDISSETKITPYVRYGDFLMRISSVISIFIVILVFIAIPLRKKL
ncbi:MAG: apolipoprotein N-acyltransferase [Bacteroidales bacterium]|nr:apolipoprotein N-acyltransferase [Bacteroidales bacterium]